MQKSYTYIYKRFVSFRAYVFGVDFDVSFFRLHGQNGVQDAATIIC